MAKKHINSDQLALFDAPEAPLRPGQMSPTQWLEKHEDQLAYHGTLRDDWEDAPTAHMGSLQSATHRINRVISAAKPDAAWTLNYLEPERDLDNVNLDDYIIDDPDSPDYGREGIPVEAKMHVRRLTDRPHSIQNPPKTDNTDVSLFYGDVAANRADVKHWKNQGYETSELPASIKETSNLFPYAKVDYSSSVEGAQKALSENRPVAYTNYVEDAGSTSYVVPKGASSTWEKDVLNDIDAPQSFKDYARQRQTTGRAGTTQFAVDDMDEPEYITQSALPGFSKYHHRGYRINKNQVLDSYQFNSLF